MATLQVVLGTLQADLATLQVDWGTLQRELAGSGRGFDWLR